MTSLKGGARLEVIKHEHAEVKLNSTVSLLCLSQFSDVNNRSVWSKNHVNTENLLRHELRVINMDPLHAELIRDSPSLLLQRSEVNDPAGRRPRGRSSDR